MADLDNDVLSGDAASTDQGIGSSVAMPETQTGAPADSGAALAPSLLSGGGTTVSNPGAPQNQAPTGGLSDQNGNPIASTPGGPTTPANQPAGGIKGLAALLIKGAIYGAAGSAGATHFGGGVAGGAAGVVKQQQQEIQNDVQQKQLQFESLRAADSHIAAFKQAQAADDAHEEHKILITQQAQDANEYAIAHGQKPAFTITGTNPNDMHSQANGGLQTLAASNGGTIPGVTTTNQPATSGDPNHSIAVYSPTLPEIQQNTTGVNKTINDWRQIQGLPPLTDQQIQMQGGQKVKGNYLAGVQQMLQEAQQGLFVVPTPSKETKENDAKKASMQQQLDSYSKLPNADPAVVKLWKSNIDTFSSSAEQTRSGIAADENATTAQTSPAKAAAEAQAKQAGLNVENSPANQTAAAHGQYLKTQAEEKAKAEAATVSGEWKPKVTADEKKKAELAENMAENANAINSILTRDPNIVGKLAGRISQGKLGLGTDDQNLSALEARVQNFGKANAGVHSLRSYEGVKDTEQAILNNFKNGPNAVAGALNATVDSAQTFIDNARPDTYATHSKQGGASKYFANKVANTPISTLPGVTARK